jgi:mevalonate pyrophosphate decarboxylase
MHKTRFFPPVYAELEPSASYLASSSSGASAFFLCLNKQAY